MTPWELGPDSTKLLIWPDAERFHSTTHSATSNRQAGQRYQQNGNGKHRGYLCRSFDRLRCRAESDPNRFRAGDFPILASALAPSCSCADIALGVLLMGLIQTRRNFPILKAETGPEAVLKNGFKLNPDIAEFALQNGGNIPVRPEHFGKTYFKSSRRRRKISNSCTRSSTKVGPRVSKRANLKHCRFGNFQRRPAVSLFRQTDSLRASVHDPHGSEGSF